MRSSAISSATQSSPQSAASPRRSFALTGRSRILDPRTHAVRPDIADVRLADQVFAPHYAEAIRRTVVTGAPLRADRTATAETLATLGAGDPFDLLDLTGGVAWGIAIDHGLVGYLDADALGAAAAA